MRALMHPHLQIKVGLIGSVRWVKEQLKSQRPTSRTIRWGAFVLVPLALAAFVLAVAVVPEWWVGRTSGLSPVERITAVAGVRQIVVFLGGGFLAVVGVYYTHKRSMSERDTNQLQQDSNYTDRYTAAVTQLGSENQTIRLGGVYALERVARDSSGDRATVEDLLAAFIRADGPGAKEQSEAPSTQLTRGHWSAPLDVAAAVTVLARRQGGEARPLDLQGAQLGALTLDKKTTSLDRWILVKANLSNAFLAGISMQETLLFCADLTHANLWEVDLTGAILFSARLDHAHLQKADMTDARLENAHLTCADLTEVNLSDADLEHARLNGAILTGATGWTSRQLELAAEWDVNTKWPTGHTPSSPARVMDEELAAILSIL